MLDLHFVIAGEYKGASSRPSFGMLSELLAHINSADVSPGQRFINGRRYLVYVCTSVLCRPCQQKNRRPKKKEHEQKQELV